ncbi:MAG: Wzz/FepE/Etk N-terminal domain-containing protein [Rikenellaceae bacterium]
MNNNISENSQTNSDFEEIDLVEVVVRLWSKRIFIVKVTGVFAVLGLLVGIFSAEEYTSEVVMVPQTSGVSFSSSNMGALAQLAGVSLGGMSSEETISPTVYNNVLRNINFQKELIYTPFYFEEYDREITLLDYYTSDEYEKFSLKKYTIGLPGLIMKAIKGEQPDREMPAVVGNTLQFYTEDEMKCVEKLEDLITLEVETTDGYVTLSATMPEAILSTQVVNRVQSLLQRYITDFKVEKATSSYDYIKERYEEAKVEFDAKQRAYAAFKDQNKLLSSARAQITESLLYSEYGIACSTYEELATQLVKAEMSVKEDTPTFTIIEPSKVPNRRSAPKRTLILVVFGFLGGVVGCGLVLLFDYLKSIDGLEIKRLESWT